MNDSNTQRTDRIKILYVDDSQDNLQLFLITFRNRFEIITSEFGQVGLRILKNNKDIHVVISDFNMPFMNGLEFIEKAREIKNDIPFYILSCSLETDEIREALQNKLIDYFFKKPLNKSQLLNEIYNYYDYQRETGLDSIFLTKPK